MEFSQSSFRTFGKDMHTFSQLYEYNFSLQHKGDENNKKKFIAISKKKSEVVMEHELMRTQMKIFINC